jgi:hypothetical protein
VCFPGTLFGLELRGDSGFVAKKMGVRRREVNGRELKDF